MVLRSTFAFELTNSSTNATRRRERTFGIGTKSHHSIFSESKGKMRKRLAQEWCVREVPPRIFVFGSLCFVVGYQIPSTKHKDPSSISLLVSVAASRVCVFVGVSVGVAGRDLQHVPDTGYAINGLCDCFGARLLRCTRDRAGQCYDSFSEVHV